MRGILLPVGKVRKDCKRKQIFFIIGFQIFSAPGCGGMRALRCQQSGGATQQSRWFNL